MVDFINVIIDGIFSLLEATNNDTAIQLINDFGNINFVFGNYSLFDLVFNPLTWGVFITAGLIKTFVPAA